MGRSTSGSIPSPMALRYGVNPHLRPAYAEPVVPGRWPLRPIPRNPVVRQPARRARGLAARPRGGHGERTAGSRVVQARVPRRSGAGRAGRRGDGADLRCVRAADLGPVARAYVRARDADPTASYGDVIAVSHPVDVERREAAAAEGFRHDGQEAGVRARRRRAAGREEGRSVPRGRGRPGLRTTRATRAGGPRDLGLRLVQPGDHVPPDRALVASGVDGTVVPDSAVEDLLLGLVVLRYTAVELRRVPPRRHGARHWRGTAVPDRLHPGRRGQGRGVVRPARQQHRPCPTGDSRSSPTG